jgi:GDP-L-fucose synthase
MKVLVTGSTGMVGRNFIEDRRSRYFELLAPGRQNLDLTDANLVKAFFQNHKPDLVVHCAGRVGGISANINYPVEFLSENLDIGKNVIMSAYQAGVKKFINLSSSCIYPKSAENPLTESQILTGAFEPTNEGYAIAKLAALKLCEYITRQNSDFKYLTLIPCNLFGNYDQFELGKSHLIPSAILKIFQANVNRNSSVEIWGDGTARREFMFVGDLVDCLYQIIERFESAPLLMNVGVGIDHSVAEYYSIIAEILNYKGTFTFDVSKPVGMKQKLVCSEVSNKWGWRSKTTLRSGLEKTVEYFQMTRNI